MNTIVISCYFHQKPYSFATFFRQLNAIDWGPHPVGYTMIMWINEHKGSQRINDIYIYIYICTIIYIYYFQGLLNGRGVYSGLNGSEKNDHSIRRSINGSLKSQESIVNTSQTLKKTYIMDMGGSHVNVPKQQSGSWRTCSSLLVRPSTREHGFKGARKRLQKVCI